VQASKVFIQGNPYSLQATHFVCVCVRACVHACVTEYLRSPVYVYVREHIVFGMYVLVRMCVCARDVYTYLHKTERGQTYCNACIFAYTYIHALIHTYIQRLISSQFVSCVYMYTYIHTAYSYTHAYINTYIHTHIWQQWRTSASSRTGTPLTRGYHPCKPITTGATVTS
jgi:hypothetical protein